MEANGIMSATSNSMARLFNERRLRIALVLLALLAAVYEAAVARTLWRYMVAPGELARRPFEPDGLKQTIKTVQPEAEEAGLQVGDTVLRIAGQPFAGAADYTRPLHSIPPGGMLAVEWQTAGGDVHRSEIRLRPMPAAGLVLGNVFLDFGIQLLIPMFCLLLGFTVAFLRPADIRSWILLGLMISFRGFLEVVSRQSHWPAGLQELGLVMKQLLPETWPLWMMLLGLHFPERLQKARWARPLIAALAAPIILSALVSAIGQWAFYHDWQLLRRLTPSESLLNWWGLPVNMTGIGLFFALAGMQWGAARTPDARRRAKLLNLGAHAALVPMLILIVRRFALGLEHTFYGVPQALTVLIYLMFALFPLTLAYIILVYRAMNIRMVLRTGLQYALAKRGVAVLQIGFALGVLFWIARFAGSGVPDWVRVLTLAAAGLVVVGMGRVADRLQQWLDRRFFREAYDAEAILSGLSEEVRRILETEPLVRRVAQRISESLHVPRVAMFLENGNGFAPAYATEGAAAAFSGGSIVARQLRQSHDPQRVYFEDPHSWVHRDRDERERLRALESQVLLPLRTREELMGFISLGPKLSEEPYTPGDLKLLRSVAAQTGLALENSRLATQVASEAARREMEDREMKITREVQLRLFPQKRPVVAGIEYAGTCRPAQSVGGDYFDFIEAPGSQFALAVGDVSGKGVPAALLMASLVAALRGQVMNAPKDLAALMGNVNRLIYDASTRSHFATLFYAQYDPVSRRLCYSNAGHNPPLLLRADGRVESLAPLGPGIGLSPRSTYKQAGVHLASGDVLVAYTDGFTEAMNAAREEFGDVRLQEECVKAKTLTPELFVEALIAAVDRFAAGAPQSDDMTVAVLKVL